MAKKSVSGRIARAAGRAATRQVRKRGPGYCEDGRNNKHNRRIHKVHGTPVVYCGACGRVLGEL